MARHDFELTKQGSRIADRKAAKHNHWWTQIQKAASLVGEAGDLDYVELSIAAKAYFVLSKLNGQATVETLSAMLPKFGWNVNDKQLENATQFLLKMKLIARHSGSRTAAGN